MRPVLVSLVAVGLACSGGCQSPSASPTAAQPAAKAEPVPPVFEFRIASNRMQEGWTEMSVPGEKKASLMVAPRPVLRLEDIDNAALSKGETPALVLSVRSSAREVLLASTQRHVYDERRNPDDWFVMLMDGQVAYAARLGMPLNRQVFIRIGKEAITEAQADRCIEAVRATGGGRK